ncbi:MAG: choice-of-anchor J domain-containing protein [Lepagella sp.]
MQWKGEQYWLPTAGFKYGDRIYGISALYMYDTMYIDRMDYDISTGEMTYSESMDNNPAHAAMTTVYDPNLNEVYAYTYTEDMEGYMFNRLEPDSFEFIKLNDNVPIDDVCLAMAYDEHRGYIVGITTDSRLVKVNQSTGIGTTLAHLNIVPDTYTTSMAYCPDTNSYLYQMIDQEGVPSMVVIDADTYEITSQKKWPDGEVRQYTVMYSTAALFGDTYPAAPVISGFAFDGPALSGTLRVTAPTQLLDGSALQSAVSLELAIDNEVSQSCENVQPGAEAVFNVENLAEGMHIFSVRASADGKNSSWSKAKKFVGYDSPKVPANVRIDGDSAYWDKVSEGESDGYIDVADVEYEVSLNDNIIGTTSDNNMILTFPEMFTDNQVSVVAVSHGKRSQLGVSEVVSRGLIAPGETIEPSENEWKCFEISDNDNDGLTWEYDYYLGTYYSADRSDEGEADDLMVLPAYKIEDAGKRHILSFNIDVEGDRDAHIKIYQGATPDLSAMTPISDDIYKNGENEGSKEMYVIPATEGKCYIAFQLLSKCSLYLESFTLSQTDALTSAPDNVTDITAKADETGQLIAEVGFTLPVNAIDGTALDSQVEVLVKSDVEEVTIVGNPGDRKNVTINVPEGLSRILIKTKNGSDCYTDPVFAGVDLPKAVENVSDQVSDDNLSVTLSWDAPTVGVNGGYIDPASLYYNVSVYDPEEGWVQVSDDLSATQFSYTMPEGSKYDAYEFYVAAGNSVGLSDDVAVCTVAMGELYNLPLKDYMEDGGSVGPLLQMGGDEYQASWTTSIPEWYDEAAAEIDDYIAVCVNYYDKPTKGSLIFPKFKPVGGEKIMTAYKFFFGEKTPDFKLYVLSPGDNKTLLADVKASDVTPGYQTIRNLVPDNLKDSPWLQIMLEVDFTGSEQFLIFPSYAITAAFDHDVAVSKISGPATLLLGEDGKFKVELENVGYEDISLPDMKFYARSGEEVLADGFISPSNSQIEILHPGDICSFDCGISLDDPRYLGAVELCAQALNDDKDLDNNVKPSSMVLSNNCIPVVTDLTARSSEDGVSLSWSQPEIGDVLEGFENCAPFSDSNSLGDFANIDNDGEYTYGYAFPYHTQGTNPTGWVVWDKETVLAADYNDYYLPASGERVAVALAPCFYEDADDWLISPRVKPGSQVKFKMAGGTDYSTETVEVLASSSDREMDSFESVEFVTVDNMEWSDKTVQLPENAKYFALRYCSNSRGCLVMIDDIEFTPATADAIFTGYDILRNGNQILENVDADCSMTDMEGDYDDLYRVRPVFTLEGETLRGFLSNTASAQSSEVAGISADRCHVYGKKQQIVVNGAVGLKASIYTVDGIALKRVDVVNDIEYIDMPSGIYIVKVGDVVSKVMVH